MLENFGSKTTNIIVLDLEGFNLKSLGFIIKELSLCSSYNDTIFFKPPLKFADLPAHDRQTVIWLTNNLHGLDWDEGDIPFCDLKTICLSFSFRFIEKALKSVSSSVSFYKKLFIIWRIQIVPESQR